ncbi:unnamed protein product, partial [Phaeothamnion confervicola]
LALGSASLAVSTTPAAAWGGGWHGHHHHHFGGGFRFYGPRYVGGYAYDGCYRRRVVGTPWGPRVRLVNVCY